MNRSELLNLRETYCRIYSCDGGEFVDRVFWQTLYPHARPVALVLYFARPMYFCRERELISTLADVTDEQQIDRELNHFNRPRLASWTKSRARIRISTRRVRYVAVSCLSLARQSRSSGSLAV